MRLKRIFTTGERAVFRIAQEIAQFHDVEALAKVRVADAIEIEKSGITNEEYSFALKAHFDVLIIRNNLPILAIEFDGPGHSTRKDALKNRLSESFGLPLVRVGMAHLNSTTLGDTAVHFLVHQLFGVEAFEQQHGHDPYEIYDPIFFVSAPGKEARFPFAYAQHWRGLLAKPFRQSLHRFGPDVLSQYEHGLLQFGCMEGAWVKDGEVRTLCSQDVGRSWGVFGRAALSFNVFGMEESRRDKFLRLHPFVIGLAAAEMYENALRFLGGDEDAAVPINVVRAIARQWTDDGFQLVLAAGDWR